MRCMAPIYSPCWCENIKCTSIYIYIKKYTWRCRTMTLYIQNRVCYLNAPEWDGKVAEKTWKLMFSVRQACAGGLRAREPANTFTFCVFHLHTLWWNTFIRNMRRYKQQSYMYVFVYCVCMCVSIIVLPFRHSSIHIIIYKYIRIIVYVLLFKISRRWDKWNNDFFTFSFHVWLITLYYEFV